MLLMYSGNISKLGKLSKLGIYTLNWD